MDKVTKAFNNVAKNSGSMSVALTEKPAKRRVPSIRQAADDLELLLDYLLADPQQLQHQAEFVLSARALEYVVERLDDIDGVHTTLTDTPYQGTSETDEHLYLDIDHTKRFTVVESGDFELPNHTEPLLIVKRLGDQLLGVIHDTLSSYESCHVYLVPHLCCTTLTKVANTVTAEISVPMYVETR